MSGVAIPQGTKWLNGLPRITAQVKAIAYAIYTGEIQGVKNLVLRSFIGSGDIWELRVVKTSNEGGIWAFNEKTNAFYDSGITDDVISQIIDAAGLEEAYSTLNPTTATTMTTSDVERAIDPA